MIFFAGTRRIRLKRSQCFGRNEKTATFVPGEVAEWSIAAVLKTVELRGSGGSNPSLSAQVVIRKKRHTDLRYVSFYWYRRLPFR